MVVKMFRHGTGSSRGVMNYMLGKKGDRDGARILEGNRQVTEMLIDNSPFKQKYTSGVLSFERLAGSISEEKKKEIMHSFENTIFVGLEREQYDILWIEHTDKNGRLELNFVIPNRELNSGKSFNPYYHKKDLMRVNSWKNIINLNNGFSDPTSPIRKRLSVNYNDFGRDEKKAYIADQLLIKLKNGDSRWQVLEKLEEIEIDGEPLQIEKSNRSGTITVLCTDGDKKKPIRLKGLMFEEDFRFSDEAKKELTEEQLELEKYRQKVLLVQSENTYKKAMEVEKIGNQERYKPRLEQQAQPQLVADAKEQENAPQRSRVMRF